MDSEAYSDQGSDGGGLRRQLEESLQKQRELEQSLSAKVEEAKQAGIQQAQRRFDALTVFGNDRPGLAEAWVEKNPEGELTPDKAKDFAAQYGVKLGEETPPPPPEPVPPEVQQAAQAFQQPTPTEQASAILSPEEFRKMLGDPATRDEALKADRENRVQRKLPKTPDDRVFPGVQDPAGFFGRPA